jgi:hypothetical protein
VVSGRPLTGMKEICAYAKRSEATVLGWIRDLDFPARKIGGIWESNSSLVDKWKIRQIEAA